MHTFLSFNMYTNDALQTGEARFHGSVWCGVK
jgi:hypothetical protein